MRNLSKLVFQRVVAVSVGIALQIIFLIVTATYLRADFFWIRIAMTVLSWVVVIYIISCGVNPSYKIAWIVLILAFPVAGLTIYLLFGGNKISSYEHRKMQSIESVTMQQLRQDDAPLWELAAAGTPAFNHARYLLSASGYPIYDDADAEYFPTGESCYAAMLEELQKAEHYIFIEFFIIATGKMWTPILELLREKAAAGVDVRVVEILVDLLDDLLQVHVALTGTAFDEHDDLVVDLRIQNLEAEFFQLGFDGVHAKTVGERRIHIQRFTCLFLRVRLLDVTPCTGVVHTVGELDDEHPYIAAHRDDHLADRLGLRRIAIIHLRQLGHAVDQTGHCVAELGAALIEGIVGVFHGIVEQSRGDDTRTHAEVGQNLRHCQRVNDVRLAGTTSLLGMLDHRAGVSA